MSAVFEPMFRAAILVTHSEPFAPGTRMEYTDEYVAGFQHEFNNGIVFGVRYIDRRLKRVIEDQGGGCEINSVSREVVFVLLLVEFESHPVTQTQDTTVYIQMSIQCVGAIRIGGRFGLHPKSETRN